MNLIQYVYTSTAVGQITKADLDSIISESAEYNPVNDLTGCLVYNQGHFIQVLEGPDSSIEQVLQIIHMNGLHTDITKLYAKKILAREFPDWAMGFVNVEHYGANLKFAQVLLSDRQSIAKGLLYFVASLKERG